MNTITKCIVIMMCVGFLTLIVYRDTLFMVIRRPFFRSSASNYLWDTEKPLPPTEKRTYTPCPETIVHNTFSSFSEFSVTASEINRVKLKWQTFVQGISTYPADKYFGRGIVSSASSEFNRCRRLIATIKLLRWLNCRLPIEVFMYSGELTVELKTDFERISGVIVRVLKNNSDIKNEKVRSFAIKPAAILYSSFEHVLWLDSDNIAIRNPEYLFDLPHYARFTTIFWPDFWSTPGKNAIWKILDIPCRAEDYEQESGQILINKRLAWKALNLALYLNSDYIISKILYGDKDTFRLSWKVLNTSFYFIRKFAGVGGFDYIKAVDEHKVGKSTNFCGHTMVQHDPLGEILFLHATLLKVLPITDFPPEKTHDALKNYANPWRIYRRYANSAPYFRPLVFQEDKYTCVTLITDKTYLPPIFEDDFHKQVSPNITAKYLSYLQGHMNNSRVRGNIIVVERDWVIK